MTYVVTDNCIMCKYTDCVEVCPVDCFYEGENTLAIHPDECIDCGACEPVCPVEAITQDRRVEDEDKPFIEDNRQFFLEVLPGRDAPLGAPGGARKVGTVGVDTPLVAAWEA